MVNFSHGMSLFEVYAHLFASDFPVYKRRSICSCGKEKCNIYDWTWSLSAFCEETILLVLLLALP